MKRQLLCLVLLICLSTVGLFATYVIETEGNDTPLTADGTILEGHYVVFYEGTIGSTDDEDWFQFPLYNTNNITVEFFSSASANLRIDFYSDNPPTVIDQTIIPGVQHPYTATYDGFYYLKVYTNPSIFPIDYVVMVTNEDAPTFLPVTLSMFTALFNNDGVGITWTTQSESNLTGYNLIRSENSSLTDGLNINGPLITAYNTSTTKTYTFRDEELDEVGEYYYWLEIVEIDGGVDYHGPVNVEITEDQEGEGIPDVSLMTHIKGSYPNPFSHDADIAIQIAKAVPAELSVYNIRGEKVNVIHNGQLSEGEHVFNWNGKDIHGREAANGIYFFRLNTQEGTYTHKITFIK